ncbi:hypothetical protein GA0070613_4164 [Micromonospora inositola]|uniref:Transposase DDE domain-containing protein n=1 Tax=Micromonospora inositola TaxID=47865 RepID=A0A1C5J8J8_9ACTN|nr:hypothetical protein GA0070613_4164 [Micromonospora inositola]
MERETTGQPPRRCPADSRRYFDRHHLDGRIAEPTGPSDTCDREHRRRLDRDYDKASASPRARSSQHRTRLGQRLDAPSPYEVPPVPRTRPDRVLADRAYTSRANRRYLRRRGIAATSQPRPTRTPTGANSAPRAADPRPSTRSGTSSVMPWGAASTDSNASAAVRQACRALRGHGSHRRDQRVAVTDFDTGPGRTTVPATVVATLAPPPGLASSNQDGCYFRRAQRQLAVARHAHRRESWQGSQPGWWALEGEGVHVEQDCRLHAQRRPALAGRPGKERPGFGAGHAQAVGLLSVSG